MPIKSPALSGGIETYILLIWIFVIFSHILTLLLCYLYLSIRKAWVKEHSSREFSNLMIEGLETERCRISRELHDSVLPLVHGSEAYNLIRSICTDLMPPDFQRLSLKDALAQHYVLFMKRSGIECVCSIDEDVDFSGIKVENQLHLYRMVQESFNNIEKHSKAKKAYLVVRRVSENVLFCVSDDGIGLINNTENLGMKSIRQRAAIIGANLDFISESGNGLMVRIEIPIRDIN